MAAGSHPEEGAFGTCRFVSSQGRLCAEGNPHKVRGVSGTMDERTIRLIHRMNPHWTSPVFPGHPEPVARDLSPRISGWIDGPMMIAVVGPRRAGKSTLMRLMIADLVSAGTDPRRILYFSFDELLADDPGALDEILTWFLESPERVEGPQGSRTFVLLDEIPHIDHWGTI